MHAPADRSSGGGARGDDSSQLIDLRTLSRMTEATTASAASAHRLAIPRFAASDLTRIAATPTPLLPPPSFIDLPPLRRPAEDRGPLYALLAALTVAVIVLGAFVVLRPGPPRVVKSAAQPAAPSVIAADRALAQEGHVPDPAPTSAAEAEPDPEPLAAAAAPIDRRTRATRPRAARREGKRGSITERSNAPDATSSAGADVTADCVLGLSDCGSRAAEKAPAVTPITPRAREGLPAKLTMIQLRTGVSAQKPAAKQCGRTQGASAGTEVHVRLSISGESGGVVSAAAQGEHARTELGRCVATALARARFPRFADPAMGFVFTVRM